MKVPRIWKNQDIAYRIGYKDALNNTRELKPIEQCNELTDLQRNLAYRAGYKAAKREQK